MHVSSVDISEPLNALRRTAPSTTPVLVRTLDHDHGVHNSRVNTSAIWWEIRPVLIFGPERLARGEREQRHHFIRRR